MSIAGAHAAAFRREVSADRQVWTLLEDDSYIAPHKPDGTRAMPFWSKGSRAKLVVDQVAAHRGLTIASFALEPWLTELLPWLAEQSVLVGVNWSGGRAVGYDVPATDVLDWFASPGADSQYH
ncbi:DUF2750 domain-containing protein [Micromonospora sp. IBHARD004]|uniref:DUF2750 domain-containing protein n=1 Tax=Micromonospora sp. IBHARD004 TaxID=3457764 RepID=UPI0040599E2C